MRNRTKRMPPMVVYVLLDADKRPLYVGSTKDLAKRIDRHRRVQTWWPDVAFVTWHAVADDRWTRFDTESWVIKALDPPHNTMCKWGPEFMESLRERRESAGPGELTDLDIWVQAVFAGRLTRRHPLHPVGVGPTKGWWAA